MKKIKKINVVLLEFLLKRRKEIIKQERKEEMNKKVKAPAGYHWMKSGKSYKLMKHEGKFKAHKGASLKASFPVQKVHTKKV